MLLPGVAATTGASAVAMKVEQGTIKAEQGATNVGKLPGFLTGLRGKVGKANKGKTNVAINALKDLPGFVSCRHLFFSSTAGWISEVSILSASGRKMLST